MIHTLPVQWNHVNHVFVFDRLLVNLQINIFACKTYESFKNSVLLRIDYSHTPKKYIQVQLKLSADKLIDKNV